MMPSSTASACARPVHLIDHRDHVLTERQCLLSTKRVCGMQPSKSVNKQQHAVDHGQHALHLSAEVRVARRIHDVDLCLFI